MFMTFGAPLGICLSVDNTNLEALYPSNSHGLAATAQKSLF